MINLMKLVKFAAGCRRLPCFLAFAVCLGFSANAAADPTFPAEIQKDLSLSYAPPCTICHDTPLGGIGTANTKFAVAMKAAGLTVNIATVGPALNALKQSQPGFIQALEDGRDPNTGAPAERYGCGARISTGPFRQRGVVSVALLTLSLLLVQRRQIRNRPGR